MDLSPTALTTITLLLLIVFFPFSPSWLVAFPILFGMIAISFRRRRRSSEDRPTGRDPSPAGDDPPPDGDASPPAGDSLPAASDAAPPAGDAPAPPPAGDAPAPPPAGDALPPALAIVAGIKKRREPESSSTSSSSYGIQNDVFLSFKGTDTRETFTDHLFSGLVRVGISVFKEDKELRLEEEISEEQIEAINRSKISIPIFSKDYAFSKNCLSELVQMLECRKIKGQTIFPIFYDVSPFDVKHQTGDFGRAFDLHKTAGVNSDTIRKWREALREVGELRGYSANLYKGYEGQLVEEVVLRVAQMLRDQGLAIPDKLVGIDSHVQEVTRKLGVAYSKGQATELRGQEVRFIIIFGAGGIGKTTVAKVVYKKMIELFEAHSFLQGVNSKGVRFSQRMLIADLQKPEPAPLESSDEGTKKLKSLFRSKRILVLLDDVDDCQQLAALVGKPDWFARGSIIIVTTRKRNIVSALIFGPDDLVKVEEHEIEPLSDDHALQLFRNHAFQGHAPEEVAGSEYDSLTKDIVKAIGGVPRDIVHHASYLSRNMGKDSWRSTLELLQEQGRTGRLPKSVMEEDRSLEIPLKASKLD